MIPVRVVPTTPECGLERQSHGGLSDALRVDGFEARVSPIGERTESRSMPAEVGQAVADVMIYLGQQVSDVAVEALLLVMYDRLRRSRLRRRGIGFYSDGSVRQTFEIPSEDEDRCVRE